MNIRNPPSFGRQATVMAQTSSPLLAQSTDREQLRQVLDTISATSCPAEYNFHLHTYASDGQLSPEELVRQVLALNLKGFTITDHHSVEGFRLACHLLPENGPQLWTGVEITATLMGCEVHILGYGFDPSSSALEPFLQGVSVSGVRAETVISALHRANGLAVLAHPFRYTRSGESLVAAAVAMGIDGLEAYYNYRNPDPWFPSPEQTRQAESLASHYGLLKTCGTDTHGRAITRRI